MKNLLIMRKLLKQYHLDYYYISGNDYHINEYVSSYYNLREWVSGFSGSAGFILIGEKEAYIWLDGRYYIQAEKELNEEWTVLKLDNKNYPSLYEFLYQKSYNKKNGFLNIGLDWNTISHDSYQNIFVPLKKRCRCIALNIWDLLSNHMVSNKSVDMIFEHSKNFYGESSESKLSKLYAELEKQQCGAYVTIQCNVIAWLLNLRSHQIKHDLGILAFLILSNDREGALFVQKTSINPQIKTILNKLNIHIFEYYQFFHFIANLPHDRYLLETPITEGVVQSIISNNRKKIELTTFLTDKKNKKNIQMIDNIRSAAILEGLALMEVIYTLEKNYSIWTEKDVAENIEKAYQKQNNFISLSFSPITAFEKNSALPHYRCDQDPVPLDSGLLLIDCGAHFEQGTTDISRVFYLGNRDPDRIKKIKKIYTYVLKGLIALSLAIFKEGTRGCHLDILARQYLYQDLKDFLHGVGHGVGYALDVHEKPIRIATYASNLLEPYMVVSNEPAYYWKDNYGIRLENIMAVMPYQESSDGKFYQFETLSLCPWELSLIEDTYLSEIEKQFINQYHQKVYQTLSPHLSDVLKEFLYKKTQSIN